MKGINIQSKTQPKQYIMITDIYSVETEQNK